MPNIMARLNDMYEDFFHGSPINIPIGDSVAVIEAGDKCDLSVPVTSQITGCRLLAREVGDMVVDIQIAKFASFPPGSSDSICGGNKLTLDAAQSLEDTTLTGWTTLIPGGYTLRVVVDSCSLITRVTLAIDVKRITS